MVIKNTRNGNAKYALKFIGKFFFMQWRTELLQEKWDDVAQFDTPKADPFCYISSPRTLKAWILHESCGVEPISTKIHSSRDSRHNPYFTRQEDVIPPEFQYWNGNSGHILYKLLHTFTKILYYTFESVNGFLSCLKIIMICIGLHIPHIAKLTVRFQLIRMNYDFVDQVELN